MIERMEIVESNLDKIIDREVKKKMLKMDKLVSEQKKISSLSFLLLIIILFDSKINNKQTNKCNNNKNSNHNNKHKN